MILSTYCYVKKNVGMSFDELHSLVGVAKIGTCALPALAHLLEGPIYFERCAGPAACRAVSAARWSALSKGPSRELLCTSVPGIEEHVADNIPLATLAEMARLSPFHFCRSFKRSFGMPP